MVKQRILFVIWSLGLGGAERVVINLAKYLNKDKFDVFICCLDDKGEFAVELEEQGIQVFALQKKRGIDMSLFSKIPQLVEQLNIDIVAPHLWGANLWTRLALLFNRKVRIIVTEHNVDVWKTSWHRFTDRLLQHKAEKIIVVSEKVKDFYSSVVGVAEEKLFVVYNGVEIFPRTKDKNKIKSMQKKYSVSDGVPVIAYIGRVVEAKRHDVFFDALRILENKGVKFVAVVAGDGPLKKGLEHEYSDLVESRHLKFVGLINEINDLLDITDISVLTSTREGFSIVVLESMAKSIPFVATDVGGNREQIVDGETGFIVNVGDSQAVAEKIEQLLVDEVLYKAMSETAFKQVQEKFSVEVMVKNFENLLVETV